jgi:hypothetical protein
MSAVQTPSASLTLAAAMAQDARWDALDDRLEEMLDTDNAKSFMGWGRRLGWAARGWVGADGESVLSLAIQHDAIACARAILDTGQCELSGDVESPLSVAAKASCGEAMADFLLSRFDPSATDRLGQNALHRAAAEGASDLLRRLLADARADVSARDGDGDTPIMCAALGGHIECARLQAQRNDSGLWVKNGNGLCAMDYVIQSSRTDIVGVLAAGADASVSSEERQERLFRAFRSVLASRMWEAADAICEQLSPEAVADCARKARGGWLSRLFRRNAVPLDRMPEVAKRIAAFEESRQLQVVLADHAGAPAARERFDAPAAPASRAASRRLGGRRL